MNEPEIKNRDQLRRYLRPGVRICWRENSPGSDPKILEIIADIERDAWTCNVVGEPHLSITLDLRDRVCIYHTEYFALWANTDCFAQPTRPAGRGTILGWCDYITPIDLAVINPRRSRRQGVEHNALGLPIITDRKALYRYLQPELLLFCRGSPNTNITERLWRILPSEQATRGSYLLGAYGYEAESQLNLFLCNRTVCFDPDGFRLFHTNGTCDDWRYTASYRPTVVPAAAPVVTSPEWELPPRPVSPLPAPRPYISQRRRTLS